MGAWPDEVSDLMKTWKMHIIAIATIVTSWGGIEPSKLCTDGNHAKSYLPYIYYKSYGYGV
jgi:hypothetical protein